MAIQQPDGRYPEDCPKLIEVWAKCQAAFRRNKAESKTWQEYNRMNRESWAEYEAAVKDFEAQITAP